ncbi:hypothetical protein PHMEG_0008399 [Phytophthora megakarya]|uniref:DDE-1 domain-containing protein n=1 Tax=Phytophthora megakarya TaxID=4795 RepID=A0A225WJ95_9STRA|nr:hypothetical protein PHMEG_0008399 [Phytophthora megakarya]
MPRSQKNTNKKKLCARLILQWLYYIYLSFPESVDASPLEEGRQSYCSSVGVDRSTLHRWKKDASRIAASRRNRCFVGPNSRAHVYVQKPELAQKYEVDYIPLRIYQLSTASTFKVCSCTLCFAFTGGKPDVHPPFPKTQSPDGTVDHSQGHKKWADMVFANNLTTSVRFQDVANVFSHSILRTVEEDGRLSYLDGPAKYASVYKMDQTVVYIDMNGRTAVDVVQENTVNGFRVSVFLTASATGKKLPPFVVFTGVPGGPVSQEVFNPEFGASPLSTLRKNAYCDAKVMHDWMEWVWKRSVDGCRLLLLDSLKIHKMESVRNTLQQECCTQVEFVPPGIT